MSARILIIEDNADNRELMRYLLNAHRYQVVCAETGPEGLAAARARRPDLILCDIQLPGIDGLALARMLRADEGLRAVPLVAVTALAMVGDRDRILRAGFDGYIDKPLAPEAFVEQISGFLPQQLRATARPAAAEESAPAAVTQRARPAAGGRRILVMDDRTENLDLMRLLLETAGYDVATAWDRGGALDSILGKQPALILSDVNMPQDDGFALLDAVRKDPALRGIAFAFVSASDWTEETRERALRLGADHFFVRTADYAALLQEIGRCMTVKAK